jgi:hypothetical protein
MAPVREEDSRAGAETPPSADAFSRSTAGTWLPGRFPDSGPRESRLRDPRKDRWKVRPWMPITVAGPWGNRTPFPITPRDVGTRKVSRRNLDCAFDCVKSIHGTRAATTIEVTVARARVTSSAGARATSSTAARAMPPRISVRRSRSRGLARKSRSTSRVSGGRCSCSGGSDDTKTADGARRRAAFRFRARIAGELSR